MFENPGAEWCASMTEGDAASSARDRLAELQEISSVVDPAGTPRRQLAEENIRRANSAGGDQLLELLNSRDSLTAALAVELLWEQRNQQFLEDWSLVESLSTTQRQNVMRSLYTTLECQQLGDCSVDTLSVGAMCLRPTFQCGGQISLDGVLYQSLSRRQLDAYYQLITRIRQIRAGSP
jgi:hypothetical protein